MIRRKKRQVDGEWEVAIIKNNEEIEDIRSIWEEMQRNEPFPVLNADIDRYISVIKALGEDVQPYILLIKQNGQPAAMAIGRVEKHPIELKLGYKTLLSPQLRCLTVVYGGILGQPEEELCFLLIGELMKVLSRREVDVVYFNCLRINSPLYGLAERLPAFWCRYHFPSTQLHWQTKIPESVESFYKTIPSKHKREWGRCERKLVEACKGPVNVVCYRDQKDINYIVKVACKISSLTYKNTMNVGFTDNPVTRSLLKQAAVDGCLCAYILYVNKVPCAFEYGRHYDATFFAEYMGYDPKWSSFGVGALLWIKVIEEFCEDPDVGLLDYGFGDAAYKRRLGTQSWEEASVYIFATRLYPIFINMVRTFTIGLNRVLEYILNKTGLRGWVKRQWRDSLQSRSVKKKHRVGR